MTGYIISRSLPDDDERYLLASPPGSPFASTYSGTTSSQDGLTFPDAASRGAHAHGPGHGSLLFAGDVGFASSLAARASVSSSEEAYSFDGNTATRRAYPRRLPPTPVSATAYASGVSGPHLSPGTPTPTPTPTGAPTRQLSRRKPVPRDPELDALEKEAAAAAVTRQMDTRPVSFQLHADHPFASPQRPARRPLPALPNMPTRPATSAAYTTHSETQHRYSYNRYSALPSPSPSPPRRSATPGSSLDHYTSPPPPARPRTTEPTRTAQDFLTLSPPPTPPRRSSPAIVIEPPHRSTSLKSPLPPSTPIRRSQSTNASHSLTKTVRRSHSTLSTHSTRSRKSDAPPLPPLPPLPSPPTPPPSASRTLPYFHANVSIAPPGGVHDDPTWANEKTEWERHNLEPKHRRRVFGLSFGGGALATCLCFTAASVAE